jgi:hypothetical protein
VLSVLTLLVVGACRGVDEAADSMDATPRFVAAPPEVLAPDLILESPHSVRLGPSGTLLVGDRRAVALLDPSDPSDVTWIGDVGEGPGEYRRVDAVLPEAAGVVVIDGRARRGTRFRIDGSVVDTWSLFGAASRSVSRYRTGSALVDGTTTVVELRSPVVNKEIGDPHELVRYDPDSGERVALASWEGVRWVDLSGGMNVPASPAEATPAVAMSPRLGLVAISRDRSPCIRFVAAFADAESEREFCFPWNPVDLAAPAPLTEEELSEVNRTTRLMLEGLGAVQEYTGRADAALALSFDGEGCLWIRTSTDADFHGLLSAALPSRRLDRYLWQVMRPTDGRILGEVELSSSFSPGARRGDELFGLLHDAYGAAWVASVTVPDFTCT